MRTEFYCRQSKASKKTGKATIQAAISIEGERKFYNLPLQYNPTEFKKLTESKKDNELKNYLESYRMNVNRAVMSMSEQNIPLTHSNLQEYIKNGGVKSYTIDTLFTDFIRIMDSRTDVIDDVKKKYHLLQKEFYNHVDKDKEVNAITHSVILSFYTNLKNTFKESTAAGKMTKLKSIVMYGMAEGKIKVNPFTQIKITKSKPIIEYLPEKDVMKILNTKLSNERLEHVRRLFVMQLGTGLSYADLSTIRVEDLQSDSDGNLFIKGERQKTGVEYTSVVLPFARETLSEEVAENGRVRVLSNQKYNAYLKEIQALTKVTSSVTLTTHLARRTYATWLINKGLRLEIVSKCLGHSNTKITASHYAKIMTDTIVSEVTKICKSDDNS